MSKRIFWVIFAVILASGALFSSAAQWSVEAQKLQNSIRTLNTLLSINPFPEEVPGLNTAITNKAEHLMGDLSALEAAMQNDLASLAADERQGAMTAYAGLLMQIADVGMMLSNRSFNQLTLNLVITYNVSYATYFSLAGQYNLVTKRLPIGTTFNDKGGWVPV